MERRFRLYAGLVRDGRWYNHASIGEIKGGGLAVLDTAAGSGPGHLLKLIQNSVKTFYTEDGEELLLSEETYFDIKVDDCWKIAIECMKKLTGREDPVFEEHFYCGVCSRLGEERFTKVEESWSRLIEKGDIDEHYLDSPDSSWEVELPRGIEIEGNRLLKGGLFKKLTMEPITIGEMMRLYSFPEIAGSETSMLYGIWDLQLKEIEGMTERDFNVYVKRNPRESFFRKYLEAQEDIEALNSQSLQIGLDARFRPVSCRYCGSEIGGYLDYTNFFEFLFPEQSFQPLRKVK